MNPNIKIINSPIKSLQDTKRRYCFDDVCSFIDKNRCLNGKILALYGLRRTGKSFLLSQIKDKYGHIAEHIEFPLIVKDKKVIPFYMEDVYNAIDECIENGKTIIMLDEITNVEDFTYDSEILADDYAKKGISIIIAGTDSLGLNLAGNNPLLGRKPDIPMTYISFAEHCHVLGTDDIDNYIKYGGLMHEGAMEEDDDMVKDIVSKRRYLNSAVSGNIARSLKRYSGYNKETTNYEEIRKYPSKDIEQIINKFVEDYSGKFEAGKINNKTIYNIVDYPLKRFRKAFSEKANIQIGSNRQKISEGYAEKINIECSLSKPATPELIDEIESVLVTLGVASSINVCLYEKIDGIWQNSKDYKEKHIIQPAIKYYQLVEAKNTYLKTADLSELKYSDREFLAKKLEEKIFGDMTESIVQFDTKNALDSNKYLVCKPMFSINGQNVGEYDMLIYNKENNSYYGFEVKHSNESHPEQYKHLMDKELTNVLNYQYGERKNVCVLYRGKPFRTPESIFYLNIADFLKAIDKYKNLEVVFESLSKDLPIKDIEHELSNETDNKKNSVGNGEGGDDGDADGTESFGSSSEKKTESERDDDDVSPISDASVSTDNNSGKETGESDKTDGDTKNCSNIVISEEENDEHEEPCI